MTQALKTALPMNVTEFLEWIKEREERYELLEGVVYMTPSPNWKHGRAVSKLIQKIENFMDATSLGAAFTEVDVHFDESNYLRPDICYCHIAKARQACNKQTPGPIRGVVPDLVIEVLSPFNKSYDLVTKKKSYQSFGVQEYWIADPEQEHFYFYTLVEGRYEEMPVDEKRNFHSKVLPSFELNLAEFWKAVSFD